MVAVAVLLSAAASMLIVQLLLPCVLRLHRRYGVLATNYEGRTIPFSLGIFLWVAVCCGYMLRWWVAGVLWQANMKADSLVWLLGGELGVIAWIGWIDDHYGGAEARGLAGHWKKLCREGVWTTGLSKAACIVCAALVFAVQTAKERLPAAAESAVAAAFYTMCGAAVIALSANAANLLDVRPGRAIKGFLLLLAPSLACALSGTGTAYEWALLFLPVLLAALVMLPEDVRGAIMLGDSGSNLLGFAAGCAMWLFAPPLAVLLMLLVLVILHAVAERSSLSLWIERIPLLRRMDQWGREARR